MVVGGMDALSESCENILTRRANQRHYCIIAQFAKRPWPCPTTGSSARLQAKNASPQLKLHRLATAKGRLSRCRAARFRCASPRRYQGDIDVNTVPDLNKATAPAATGQTRASAAPRIKLLSHGCAIDHPDPELGEQLMADALGIAAGDAMHGILRQLVKASVRNERPDVAVRVSYHARE